MGPHFAKLNNSILAQVMALLVWESSTRGLNHSHGVSRNHNPGVSRNYSLGVPWVAAVLMLLRYSLETYTIEYMLTPGCCIWWEVQHTVEKHSLRFVCEPNSGFTTLSYWIGLDLSVVIMDICYHWYHGFVNEKYHRMLEATSPIPVKGSHMIITTNAEMTCRRIAKTISTIFVFHTVKFLI